MLSSLLDPKLLGGILAVVGGGFLVSNLSSRSRCTKPSWLIDFSDPVMDCQKGNEHYQVFLTSFGTINQRGGGISFRLFDVNHNKNIDLTGSENQFSGADGARMQIAGQGNSWRIYQLKSLAFNENISLMKPQGGSGTPQTIECQNSKIKEHNAQNNLNENIANIKFEVKDCFPATGRRECNVVINSSNKLEWTGDFKPRVGFCDPAHHSKL